MIKNNLNEIALSLIQSKHSKQNLRIAVPNNLLRKAFDIALKYEKNNPVIYIMDYVKAKIIKTTLAEYDLSFSKKSSHFSKPYFKYEDLMESCISPLKDNLKILMRNDPNIKYSIN